jgi:hypothetical protein
VVTELIFISTPIQFIENELASHQFEIRHTTSKRVQAKKWGN